MAKQRGAKGAGKFLLLNCTNINMCIYRLWSPKHLWSDSPSSANMNDSPGPRFVDSVMRTYQLAPFHRSSRKFSTRQFQHTSVLVQRSFDIFQHRTFVPTNSCPSNKLMPKRQTISACSSASTLLHSTLQSPRAARVPATLRQSHCAARRGCWRSKSWGPNAIQHLGMVDWI